MIQKMNGDGSTLHSFGQFEFDGRTLELRRGTRVVRLAPKPSQALARLLQVPGEIVLRHELIEALWETSPVEVDRSLNFAIRQIRTALGDDANRPVFLETVPRRGYRFIAPVSTADGSPTQPSTPHNAPPTQHARLPSTRWLFATATLVTITFGLSRLFGSESAVPTVVVLPIEQLGDSNDNAYFASGLRHELVAELARFPADKMAVIAKFSSTRMAGESLDNISDVVGADYVLRGSVTGEGTSVRVVFELVSSPEGHVLWAERFEEDLPTSTALERIVAARVAAALTIELFEPSATKPSRAQPSVVARELYLKGTHLLREKPWARLSDAIGMLYDALGESPEYAEAHVALGRALLRVGDADGRAHLETATKLDPLVAGAHEAMADDDLYRNWDMAGAAREYDLAVATHPGAAAPHHRRAYFLSLLGKHDAAIASISRALELDPVSPIVTGDVGRLYYRAGRFDEAEEFCTRSLELLGNEWTGRSCLLNLRLVVGDLEGSIPHAAALMEISGADSALQESLGTLTPRDAINAYWSWRIQELSPVTETDPDVLIPIAQAHVWLGNFDQALSALEEALRRRSSLLPLVAGDPCFAPLFSHPRYQSVFKEAGLPLTPPPNLS